MLRKPIRSLAAACMGAAVVFAAGSCADAASTRGQGQGCSSSAPSLGAVDTCAPFTLPDMQLRAPPEYRPAPEPKPLFLPPVVNSAKPQPSGAPGRPVSLKPGMLYASTRGILIGQGFYPAASGRESSDRCGPEAEICHDFPEVHACSGASVITCEFVFERPPGEALVVTTSGSRSLELVTRAIQRASTLDLARHKVGR